MFVARNRRAGVCRLPHRSDEGRHKPVNNPHHQPVKGLLFCSSQGYPNGTKRIAFHISGGRLRLLINDTLSLFYQSSTIERVFAWEDKFRRLLFCFDRLSSYNTHSKPSKRHNNLIARFAVPIPKFTLEALPPTPIKTRNQLMAAKPSGLLPIIFAPSSRGFRSS